MNPGLKRCYDAFERLKKGEPEHEQFKGLPQDKITNSIVSQEAGFDGGYLKASRGQHRPLISLITLHVKEHQGTTIGKQEAINRQKTKAKKATASEAKMKQQLDDALGRELQLYRRLKEVEGELAELKQKVEAKGLIDFPF